MTITEHINPDRLEVRFKGTLDHTIGSACERAIRHAHALGTKRLQFNLADVTGVEKVKSWNPLLRSSYRTTTRD